MGGANSLLPGWKKKGLYTKRGRFHGNFLDYADVKHVGTPTT